MNQISTRDVLLALIERKGDPWAALWGRDIARGKPARTRGAAGAAVEAVRHHPGHDSGGG